MVDSPLTQSLSEPISGMAQHVTPTSTALSECVLTALDDMKGLDVVRIDVKGLADFADEMIVVTGTSTRHLAALARSVSEAVSSKFNQKALHIEGDNKSDWVLVDFVDVIVHIMLAETRDLYDLERLWSVRPSQNEAN